jgi:hypothetical protein
VRLDQGRTARSSASAQSTAVMDRLLCTRCAIVVAKEAQKPDHGLNTLAIWGMSALGGDVDARHHCYLRRLGSSIDHFGASRPLASKQSRSNRAHCLPYRASGKRMRVRISAHPMAGSVGPLALGPLHFEDAQESISRKHGELARCACYIIPGKCTSRT